MSLSSHFPPFQRPLSTLPRLWPSSIRRNLRGCQGNSINPRPLRLVSSLKGLYLHSCPHGQSRISYTSGRLRSASMQFGTSGLSESCPRSVNERDRLTFITYNKGSNIHVMVDALRFRVRNERNTRLNFFCSLFFRADLGVLSDSVIKQ